MSSVTTLTPGTRIKFSICIFIGVVGISNVFTSSLFMETIIVFSFWNELKIRFNPMSISEFVGFTINISEVSIVARTLFLESNTYHPEPNSKNGSYELELAAFELGSAISSLDSFLGKITSQDVLERVFANFCVGK